MKHGLFYTGICKGVRNYTTTNRKTGEQKTHFVIGLSTPVENGYENQERIFEVELGKKALAAGLQNQFDQFKDKLITLPVFQQHRAWKDNVYTNTYFGSDTILDVTVLEQTELKKVG
jgi:hypothetical protein